MWSAAMHGALPVAGGIRRSGWVHVVVISAALMASEARTIFSGAMPGVGSKASFWTVATALVPTVRSPPRISSSIGVSGAKTCYLARTV